MTVVGVPRPDLVDDTLYPQVRKAERAIAQELLRSGFELLGSAAGLDRERVYLVFEVANRRRAGVRLQVGPPAGIDRAGHFLEKWCAPDAPVLQGPYVRSDGRLAVETRVSEREIESVLRTVWSRLSLGKDLTARDPSSVMIRPLEEVSDRDAVRAALSELLGKRLPWLADR